MEETLTLDELYLLIEAKRNEDHANKKFAAALKGVDLDEATADTTSFDEVQKKAAAALAGKSEEEYVFDLIGIEIEDDDE